MEGHDTCKLTHHWDHFEQWMPAVSQSSASSDLSTAGYGWTTSGRATPVTHSFSEATGSIWKYTDSERRRGPWWTIIRRTWSALGLGSTYVSTTQSALSLVELSQAIFLSQPLESFVIGTPLTLAAVQAKSLKLLFPRGELSLFQGTVSMICCFLPTLVSPMLEVMWSPAAILVSTQALSSNGCGLLLLYGWALLLLP